MQQPGLTANLDVFDLLDLVQVIHMDRRDLSLVVRDGAKSLGALRFSQGELLWAEFRELRGEGAFIALASQKAGSLEQLPWDGHGERNVTQPLARLIMQAVAYRDAHGDRPARQTSDNNGQQPPQTLGWASAPALSRERAHGGGSQLHLNNGQTPAPRVVLPDDSFVPDWVREIQTTSGNISYQTTSALPPMPTAGAPSSSSISSIEPATPSSSPMEEAGTQHLQPTLPLATPNGKFTLPSLANGNRASQQTSIVAPDDPPTVPLPTVQGGLLDYASKRESQVHPSPPDAVPPPVSKPDMLPEQAVTLKPSPAETIPTSPPPVPQAEAKQSSLSILEQLAYGRLSSNGGDEKPALGSSVSSGWIEDVTTEPLPEPSSGQRTSSRLLEEAPQQQQSRASYAEIPVSPALSSAPKAASERARVAHLQNSFTASPTLQPAGEVQPLPQALELFAGQVGSACITTAVVRADGSLVAEYSVRRSQEQELISPAYHLANVMQSSLRALIMGEWGDLEDTMITSSTHLVVLRRLGRAEKGLFHIAVLERSGNPGLCRVRMRNNEQALIQAL